MILGLVALVARGCAKMCPNVPCFYYAFRVENGEVLRYKIARKHAE